MNRRISRIERGRAWGDKMDTPAGHANGRSARPLPSGNNSWPRIAGLALLLTASPFSRAAGLGDLQRQSALGEPLDVVIKLSNDGAGDADELNARIASEATYESLGLQRDRVLQDAGVSIEKGQGGLRLHVTSSRLVMEPILSLVIEVNFGAGMVRRNYDLLIDPPASDAYTQYAGAAPAPRAAEVPEPASVQIAKQEQAQERPLPAAVADRRRHAPRPQPQNGEAVRVARHPRAAPQLAVDGDTIPVAWGTTLGHIAAALRARPGIPLSKMEQALYEANPQAFSGGPSKLLAGARLRVPDSELFLSRAERIAAAATPSAALVVADAAPAAARFEPAAAAATAMASAAAPGAGLIERMKLSGTESLSALAPAPLRALGQTAEQATLPVAPVPVTVPAAALLAPAPIARAASTEWSLPLRILFSFQLWGGLAIVWLGIAWLQVRRTLAARSRLAPGRDALGAPLYRALSMSLSDIDLGTSRIDKKRKLHALERNDFTAFAESWSRDVAPTTSAAASEIEVNDTSQYSEAEDFLVAALALHPERADLRLKLLEVYSAAGNLQGFNEQAQQYAARNKGERGAHWSEVRRMGLDLDPDWNPIRAAARELPLTAAATPVRVRRFYDGLGPAGLETAIKQLDGAYARVRNDPAFIAAIIEVCTSEVGLPTPYHHAEPLSRRTGGAQIYIKRADLRPPDADLLVNALGQVVLAKWIGRSGVVAGLEDCRHAEAVAKAARAMNLPATICAPRAFLDDPDHPAVRSLGLLNAILMPTGDEDGVAVPDGRRSAIKRWIAAPQEVLYVSSLRSSPMPYPLIVRDFQALIGQEVRRQAFRHAGGLPRAIVSSIDGGYATFGLIQSFLDTGDVRIDCVEMQQEADEVSEATAAAALAAPSYARELKWVRTTSRVNFSTVPKDAVAWIAEVCSAAGEAVPKPSNACALAQAVAIARELPVNASVVVLFA